MTRYLIILLVVALPFVIKAQEPAYNSEFQLNGVSGGYNAGGNIITGTALPGLYNPVDFHLQTGMSAGTLGFGGNFLQSYVSPSFAMPLNKKLSISAGVTYSHTTLNNLPLIRTNGEVEKYSGGMNTLTMYTSGLYRVNDKLTVTGSAYKTVNPSFNARLSPQALQLEAKGVSVGVDYKLGENTHIGAEIRMQQRTTNFYNPFNAPNGYYERPYYPGGSVFPFGSSGY